MLKRSLIFAIPIFALLSNVAFAECPAECPSAIPITTQQFMDRVTEATKGFSDLTVTVTVVEKNKKAMAKMDPRYTNLYELKTATAYLKEPGKMRTEGKLGMVSFQYIINGYRKITHAAKIGYNSNDDCSADPGKLSGAIDMGVLTPSLWTYRRLEIIPDAVADAAGEIKIRYHYAKGDMMYLIWVDAKNLWLKRYEKRDSRSVLQVRYEYLKPVQVGGVIWIPTRLEMYTPDGTKVGATEYSNIKVNTGLEDKLFQ